MEFAWKQGRELESEEGKVMGSGWSEHASVEGSWEMGPNLDVSLEGLHYNRIFIQLGRLHWVGILI
jgi:hypothetical protein